MQKKKFQISTWWQDVASCSFGTIVGIALTVGITFWQQRGDQKEMTRKITKITLHNLDVRIDHIKDVTDILAAKDSIYWSMQKIAAHDFEKQQPDSLLDNLNQLATTYYPLTDTKSEVIFSHSFEVWQYLEDEKVIGRISNCYSMVEFGEKLATECEAKVVDALYRCQLKIIEQGIEERPAEMVKLLMRHPETVVAFQGISKVVQMLRDIASIARQLNDRNKLVLGLSQEELEEVGNLLEQNYYKMN